MRKGSEIEVHYQPVYVTEADRLEQESAIEKVLSMENRPKSFHIVTYGCQMNEEMPIWCCLTPAVCAITPSVERWAM